MTLPTETETDTEPPYPPQAGEAVPDETPDTFPGFDRFWAEWPTHRRKAAKDKCRRRWERARLEPIAEQVLAGLRRWKASRDWQKQSGDFIPAPLVWLNSERWKVPAAAFADQGSEASDDVTFKSQFTPEIAAAAGVPFSENGGGE